MGIFLFLMNIYHQIMAFARHIPVLCPFIDATERQQEIPYLLTLID
jgi:hypothetical protein